MLMHCFWLLEFKFAFEFKCLIFSLNLSKFRSLEKAPDLLLLKAQPSYRCLAAEVRWRSSDSRPSSLRHPSRPNSSPTAARLLRAGPRCVFPRSLSLTRGTHMSSPSPHRPRAGLEPEFELGPRRLRVDLARTPMRGPRHYLRSRHRLREPRTLKP